MNRQDWYWNVYLNSDHWRDFRKEYFDHYGTVCCTVCGRQGGLHLHHVTYTRLGREDLSDIAPLCGSCHERVHQWLSERKLPVEATAAAISNIKTGVAPFRAKQKKKKKGRSAKTAKQRRRLAYEAAMKKQGKPALSNEHMKQWAKKRKK